MRFYAPEIGYDSGYGWKEPGMQMRAMRADH